MNVSFNECQLKVPEPRRSTGSALHSLQYSLDTRGLEILGDELPVFPSYLPVVFFLAFILLPHLEKFFPQVLAFTKKKSQFYELSYSDSSGLCSGAVRETVLQPSSCLACRMASDASK